MVKRGKNKKHTHKFLIFLIIVFLIIGIFLFVTRYYLYIKFLFVEDVLVSVETQNPYIELRNGETQNVSFSFQTTSNIFCKVECDTSFRELNNENYTETKTYVRPRDKVTKTYQISSNKNGEGLDLYRFDISCNSIKSFMCPTSGFPTKRNSIVSVNHTLNNFEEDKKKSYINDINSLVSEINYINIHSTYFYDSLLEMNKTVLSYSDINKTEFVLNKINYSLDSLNNLQEIWSTQDYNEIELSFREVIKNNDKSIRNFKEINSSMNDKINNYNRIVLELNNIYINLTNIDSYNFNNETDLLEINSTIKDYNNLVNNIKLYSNIENKIILLDSFNQSYMKNITYLNEKAKSLEKAKNTSDIFKIELKKIEFNDVQDTANFTFDFSIQPQCCLFGKCEKCCFNDACRNNNYPVIFLHGHQIIKQESPEYSLEALNKIQEKIEPDNYLSDGTTSIIIDKNDPKIIQYFNVTATFRASYYYDLFNDPENPIVVSAKSDNIDTYAIRLKNIVDVVKEKTGRPKVIIVGYSMGGLVTRRYIQLFSENDVDKIILIASPNHGIRGDVAQYCGIFGEANHCKDMKYDSVFMNNLNGGNKPNIPVYNIIGTGCDTYGEDGDGIVTSKSSFLDFANNFYVDGTCDNLFDPLHARIVQPDEYPITYEKILDILKT